MKDEIFSKDCFSVYVNSIFTDTGFLSLYFSNKQTETVGRSNLKINTFGNNQSICIYKIEILKQMSNFNLEKLSKSHDK